MAARAEIAPEVASGLWSLMGFAAVGDDDPAFTQADVEALALARDLMHLNVLCPEPQSALGRTWGRSFARLAEAQTELLTTMALEHGQKASMAELLTDVLPRVEKLQSYVWRRHLATATVREAVGIVDIVGCTSPSGGLSESELAAWLAASGSRIVKSFGHEVLFCFSDAAAALRVALALTERGANPADPFPEVRAGLAFGDVVMRHGDVCGPTVTIAARLTSAAQPSSVLVDEGLFAAVTAADTAEDDDVQWRRVRRLSVKGSSQLSAWAARSAS